MILGGRPTLGNAIKSLHFIDDLITPGWDPMHQRLHGESLPFVDLFYSSLRPRLSVILH